MNNTYLPPNLEARAFLIKKLRKYVEGRGLTQEEVSRELNTSQARVSDIVRWNVEEFTIDALVNMCDAAGLEWDIGQWVHICQCELSDLSLVRRTDENHVVEWYSIYCKNCQREGPQGKDKKEAMSLWLEYVFG